MFSLPKGLTLGKIFFAFTIAWALEATFIYYIEREPELVVLGKSKISGKHVGILMQGILELQKNETECNYTYKYQVETNGKREKFYIAFSYSEQLSEVTESLLDLMALAKHGGRQVVFSFV